MKALDTLIRNDYRLALYAKDQGYQVVFTTPSGTTSQNHPTFGEAKDDFKAAAIEFDMVSLDI